jgi:hypothetical protein
VTANKTQLKRNRGGQKGNRNARKHRFYSGTLSPAETSQLWNITNLEGVHPEIALIRVKLQSSLQSDAASPRVMREASRLLVKWYSESYGLDATDRSYLKTVVDNLLEIASLRQSANPRGSQSNRQIDETNRVYFNNRIGRLTYGRELLNSRKNSNFYKTNHPGFPASVRQPSPLVKTNGKPTKRIRPTLTTE